jgi:hypothetical protein
LIAQSQADGIRLVRTNLIADREGVSLERVKCLRPILTAMDVGTIGQMKAVRQFHKPTVLRQAVQVNPLSSNARGRQTSGADI